MRITEEQLKQIIIEELDNLMNEEEQDLSQAKEIVDQFLTPEAGIEYWVHGFEFLSQLGFIPPLERGTYIEKVQVGYLKDKSAQSHTPADGLEIHYWSDVESITKLKEFLESMGIKNYATTRYGKNPFKKDFSGADPDFDKNTATGVWYRTSGKDGIILFDAQDHV
tara:strand:+ start:41 stop:538 length:498 start_codon:yes stop_codon:yes gene_type:complete